jgi:hypothetical protein
MLGVKLQRQHGGLGIKNNVRGSNALGKKNNPNYGKKNSLISYNSSENKKSYLEK